MAIRAFLKTLVPFHIIFFYQFIASGLIVNFLQLLSLVIWPFNKKLYRKINLWLAYSFWCNLTALCNYWSGSTVNIYMDPKDFAMIPNEHAICIMNHKYDVDWLMGWVVCQRAKMLSGSKIIGKASLKFVPLLGWAWLATESIFIERQWETDKKKLTEGLDKILNDYPDDYFFNVLMFCEGTRFTKSKHETSMKVAREKGMPELKHHLLPRTKGFSMLNRGASGRINAIYDLTIGIAENNGIKPDLNAIRNGIPFTAEFLVRRIPITDVPTDDEGSAAFIHDLYRKKDEIFDVYDKTGSFKSLNVPLVNKGPNYEDWYLCIMWMVLLVTPLIYFIFNFIQTATLFQNCVLLFLMFLCTVGANLFISCSTSSKGSAYGKAAEKKSN